MARWWLASSTCKIRKKVLIRIWLSNLILSDSEDSYVWRIHDNINQPNTTGTIYRAIRDEKPIVSWVKKVWIPSEIPKHKFFTWLVVLNCLPTRDKLLNWGLQTHPNCLLCNSAPETRNHIFSIVLSPGTFGFKSQTEALINRIGTGIKHYLLWLQLLGLRPTLEWFS